MEEENAVPVVINCDGWYPVCSNCGYWLKSTDEVCPECNRNIDWGELNEDDFKRI